MNRSLIAVLCLTTTLGAVNFAGAMDPQPPARTGVSQPAPEEIEAFLTATKEGDLDAAKAWVAQGRDIDVRDNFGATPLMRASDEGHLPIVQYLIEHKADVNAKAKNGATALIAAAHQDHLPIVQHLLSRGADVNATTNTGRTALHVTRMRLREQTIFGLLLGAMTDSGIKEEYPF